MQITAEIDEIKKSTGKKVTSIEEMRQKVRAVK